MYRYSVFPGQLGDLNHSNARVKQQTILFCRFCYETDTLPSKMVAPLPSPQAEEQGINLSN